MCETVLLMLQPSHFSSYWDIGHFTMKHVTSSSYITQPPSLHRWPSLAIQGVEWCFRCSKISQDVKLTDFQKQLFVLFLFGYRKHLTLIFPVMEMRWFWIMMLVFFYFSKEFCFKARTSRCRWWRSIKGPTQCPAVRYSCHQERHFAVSATTPNTTRMPGQENNKNKKWKPNNNLTCRRILILLFFQQSP